MTKHGLTFRALIDSQAAIQTSYGITGVPETFIIDKEGILARKVIGPLDWSAPEVLAYIRKLIQAP
jgi:peroxiredoxin